MKKMMALVLSAVLVAGCTSITETNRFSHGYTPSNAEVEEIINLGANKNTISQQFGKPLVVGTYDPNFWYYISYSTEQYGFSKRIYTKFSIVEFEFKNGLLKNAKRFNKDNLQRIAFNAESTKASGKKLGALEQVLGNIGKFRPKAK